MTNQTKKNANNYMFVNAWLERYQENYCGEILAEQNKDGKWECMIYIPMVGASVRSNEDTEVNAIIESTKKASLLINAYLESHPDKDFSDLHDNNDYVYEEDDKGNLKEIHPECSKDKRRIEEFYREREKFVNQLEEGIRLEKSFQNSVNGLAMFAFDRNQFKGKTNDEIREEVETFLHDNYSIIFNYATYVIKEDIVFVYGKVFKVSYISIEEAKKLSDFSD